MLVYVNNIFGSQKPTKHVDLCSTMMLKICNIPAESARMIEPKRLQKLLSQTKLATLLSHYYH